LREDPHTGRRDYPTRSFLPDEHLEQVEEFTRPSNTEMHMTRNMGTTDRTLRAMSGVLVLGLWGTGLIGGTLALILGIVAMAFLFTSAGGWCPLYVPLGISTRRDSSKVLR
jgi:uncharacterized membrane protein YkgB